MCGIVRVLRYPSIHHPFVDLRWLWKIGCKFAWLQVKKKVSEADSSVFLVLGLNGHYAIFPSFYLCLLVENSSKLSIWLNRQPTLLIYRFFKSKYHHISSMFSSTIKCQLKPTNFSFDLIYYIGGRGNKVDLLHIL